MQPVIVMLHRGALRIALTAGAVDEPTRSPIEHVGLQVTADQLRTVRARVEARGLRVVAQRENELFDFIDQFGVEWELDTRSFADPRAIMEAKRRRTREAV